MVVGYRTLVEGTAGWELVVGPSVALEMLRRLVPHCMHRKETKGETQWNPGCDRTGARGLARARRCEMETLQISFARGLAS